VPPTVIGVMALGVRFLPSPSDEGKTANVAIVNQAFADRYFPHADAIGRKIWMDGRDKPAMEIVGEVSNGRTDDLTQARPRRFICGCGRRQRFQNTW
jgi:hypothetical protein